VCSSSSYSRMEEAFQKEPSAQKKLLDHMVKSMTALVSSLPETTCDQLSALYEAAERNLTYIPTYRYYPTHLGSEAQKAWSEEQALRRKKEQTKRDLMSYLGLVATHPEKLELIPLLFKNKDYIDLILTLISIRTTEILDLLLENYDNADKLITFLAEMYNEHVVKDRVSIHVFLHHTSVFHILFNYLVLQGNKAGEVVTHWLTKDHPAYHCYEALIFPLLTYSAEKPPKHVSSLTMDPGSRDILIKYSTGETERLENETFKIVVPSTAPVAVSASTAERVITPLAASVAVNASSSESKASSSPFTVASGAKSVCEEVEPSRVRNARDEYSCPEPASFYTAYHSSSMVRAADYDLWASPTPAPTDSRVVKGVSPEEERSRRVQCSFGGWQRS